jgi:hypothetical protein
MTSVLLQVKRKKRERKPVAPMMKEEVARHGKEGWLGGRDIIAPRLEEVRRIERTSSYRRQRHIVLIHKEKKFELS